MLELFTEELFYVIFLELNTTPYSFVRPSICQTVRTSNSYCYSGFVLAAVVIVVVVIVLLLLLLLLFCERIIVGFLYLFIKDSV